MPREPVILFVGSLWYAPNIEAVSWFIEHCLAGIRRQVPGARFRVVGAGPEDRRRRWMATPGVDCTGFVDDLAAQYALASVTIAPLHYGGGTQIKTLESIAYGRAPIVSTFVFDGYDGEFVRDRSLRVADTPDETIGACVELLTDPARAVELAAAGHAVVAERFSEATFAAAVRAGVARTTATSP
jgi:glycosyltransferase involved in cell wall biosynthesis